MLQMEYIHAYIDYIMYVQQNYTPKQLCIKITDTIFYLSTLNGKFIMNLNIP